MPLIKKVDELFSSDKQLFQESYKYRKPCILRGAAKEQPAWEKWTNDYLRKEIGSAHIQPLYYPENKRDYRTAKFLDMQFSDFLDRLCAGNKDILYWFEGPSSANFWGGEDKDVRINSDLKSLSNDFVIPSYFKASEIILAQIIMGTGKNGTLLHHDFGGEAKALAQLRGEKDIILVAPQFSKYLKLNTLHGRKNFTVSNLDIRDEIKNTKEDFPVYSAHIFPGDILYWPSFWFHDISNIGDINLAINIPLDELPANSAMLRHFMNMFLNKARNMSDSYQSGSTNLVEFIELLSVELENEALEKCDVSTFWELHTRSSTYQGKHWRKRKDQAEQIEKETV